MLCFRKIVALFFLILLLQGCLVFQKVSYEVNLTGENSGNVVMEITNICSDAMNSSELEQDKKQLFQELYKSDEFVAQMKEEGRNILDRQLFVSEGKLNGIVKYSFDDISSVENFVYEEPFYFVTLELQDSIISTNGEVIKSEDHKRIMWDSSIKILKFEMFSTDVEGSNLVKLAPYFED